MDDCWYCSGGFYDKQSGRGSNDWSDVAVFDVLEPDTTTDYGVANQKQVAGEPSQNDPYKWGSSPF